ncbi:SMI1/KNR4 family protein [Streptomyces sp. NPDC051994]|uniref:SMI1/KNR4 family protein n=1 Tax=unclassified Streptomyces TaxID=2593676 RepID=UPI00341801F7
MNTSVQRLMGIVQHSDESGDVVDWEALQGHYGAGFPTDYREFTEFFGEGSFNEDGIMVPIPRSTPGQQWRTHRLPDDTIASPDMQNWARPELAGRHSLSDMLVWGSTGGADVLCWLTEDRNPDMWPVAVWSRDDASWELYECGMAEFLVRVFTADFGRCPLSDLSVWGRPVRFLHAREEERLRGEGLNPWTGEANPFAGMEYD